MKILFLVPYPNGEAPSQRFRFEQYLNLLPSQDIKFEVSSFWTKRAWKILYRPGYFFEKMVWLLFGFFIRWIDVFRCVKFDLIFIHRECAPIGPPLGEYIIGRVLQKKIVYDFDDAIWLPNTSSENKIVRWVKYHDKVKFICRWSSKVSCGNEWLARYARQYNPNVITNPTTIDTENLHNPDRWDKKKSEKIIIGWTGTHSTLFYLNKIEHILMEVEKRYPVTIQIISNKKPRLNLKSLEYIKWDKNLEIEQLSQFDIGLMPLEDDDWARGKCGFKALQYLALRIPCVASPVGVTTEIIQDKVNGFLCSNDQEWMNALEILIKHETIRNTLGVVGRERIVNCYSVASNASTFFSLTRV